MATVVPIGEVDVCTSGSEREDGGDDWGFSGGVDERRLLSSEVWLSTISSSLEGGSGVFDIGGPSISLSGVDGFRRLGVIFGLVMTLTEGSVCLGVSTSCSDVVWSILGAVCK